MANGESCSFYCTGADFIPSTRLEFVRHVRYLSLRRWLSTRHVASERLLASVGFYSRSWLLGASSETRMAPGSGAVQH